MSVKKKNHDITFIIFIFVLVIALFVSSVITFIKDSNDTNVDYQNPTEPPLDDVLKEDIINYQMPRKANLSLSPNISWENSIGGSGVDEIKDVVILDNMYVFGETDSTDYDFNSTGGKDLFLAVLSQEGEVLSTTTFGTEKEDTFLFVKPCYGESGSNFLVFAKSEDKNLLTVYSVSLDKEQEITSNNFEISGEFEVLSTYGAGNKVLLLANVLEKDVQRYYLYYFDGNGQILKQYKSASNKKAVAFLYNGIKSIVLVENISQNSTLGIDEISEKGQTFDCVKNNYQDKERIPISFFPDKFGYVLVYKMVEDGEVSHGLMRLSHKLSVDFDHKLAVSNYDHVYVFADEGVEDIKGYHVFATKYTNLGYKTYYENVNLNGTLSDYSAEFLPNVKVLAANNKESGTIILGEVITGAKSKIYLAAMSKNATLTESYSFGGTGNDTYQRHFVLENGKLVIFGNTTSSVGDISLYFGKTDGFIMQFEN